MEKLFHRSLKVFNRLSDKRILITGMWCSLFPVLPFLQNFHKLHPLKVILSVTTSPMTFIRLLSYLLRFILSLPMNLARAPATTRWAPSNMNQLLSSSFLVVVRVLVILLFLIVICFLWRIKSAFVLIY